MRRLAWIAAALSAVLLLVLGASLAMIESEEVVVLYTSDARGEYSTRIWIVDHDGAQWIAPGNRSNAWFQRLQVEPRVELDRSGVRSCHAAAIVDGPEALAALELFLEKYASVIRATTLLNQLLEPGGDESPAVAVRLDPCMEQAP